MLPRIILRCEKLCEDLHSISVIEKRNLKRVTMSWPKNKTIVPAVLCHFLSALLICTTTTKSEIRNENSI